MNTILIIILILISIMVTVVYLAYTIKKFRVPISISDTRYHLKKENKRKALLFSLWTVVAALPLMFAWYSMATGGLETISALLSTTGLLFVGAAPNFKSTEGLADEVHFGGAGVCLVGAMLLVVLWGYLVIPLILFSIAGFIIYLYGKPIFWIEIAGLLAAFVASLLKVL
jgi:hypothetical protein